MDIGRILQIARRQKNLSQMEVARRSHVSLATIQNIEAGRANPSWDTLSALLKTLNLKIEIQNSPLDWPLLAALGCPLVVDTNNLHVTPSDLKSVLTSLDVPKYSRELNERQSQALAAWLWALRDHYPSLWRQAKPATRKWLEDSLPVSLKLRRLSLSLLGSYL